jgi:glycosyltransferase involved in cell wall biosynthesis
VFPNVSNRLAYHLQLFLPLGLSTFLSEHAGGFDVAHLHACRNIPGAIAAHHLRRAGVPYVLAPNGTAPRLERRLLAKRVFDVLMGNTVLSGATRVLAVSDAERRQLTALAVDDTIIRVVPNPVDLSEFSETIPKGAFRRRHRIPPAVRVVMFLGKLTPRKRVDVLVNAFARLEPPLANEARLVIAGNDMGSGASIRSLVAASGLESRTTFCGLLKGRERLEALADADVLVYPSQDEAFGLVPLEALLAGSPVIVADDSGCGEIVRRIDGGAVIAAGNVAALAEKIAENLAAPPQTRLAANRIRELYGDDAVCAQVEQVYREMVSGS